MKVEEKKFKEADKELIIEIMAEREVPSRHPEYKTFKENYQAFCPAADDVYIENLWNKLIKGYISQLTNLRQVRQDHTNKQYLDIVNSNVYFREAVEMIQRDGGLEVPADQELALWTGGYDLSPAISRIGYCPLEATPFGNILDNLYVTWEWKREAGLWNILSSAFVQGYARGRRAHVYFRTVDEMSVLYAQELPMLMEDEQRVIVMHPIYYQGNQVSEVGYISEKKRAHAINLSRKNYVFGFYAKDLKGYLEESFQKVLALPLNQNLASDTYNQKFPPYEALAEMIGRQHFDENAKASLNYRSDKFIPGHAPFAREDEPTAGWDKRR